ncbi:hypothetical protein A3A71_01865 [Candidatus Berkelbacteria bacterium RIFCSPLOWO2_01_FULL_50_28]|uniref:Peptidase E n=1 Tax=Candidatus Berkelbacteria bacterium RIFCSPLOWO2_01_FULL_50_28 TaxID=1797471 RepID=A0A1F5EBN1_9BACT|nr:MAG: hypothetical protein A3F39_00170 [Candidatus Berkelbacteria bacterium RIFCSPHIGHO2_12_FULL_50_11]OGD64773.1 MAG: hypothetical protein A3A71_01865 [Candidatus Berkelbacteria bacterium RIFCSPLOWO2_01_FULL_50_28]
MKLFLSSLAVPKSQTVEFLSLVGKPASEIRLALIENAADVYPEERKSFIERDRSMLKETGVQITRVDLNKFNGPEEVRQALQGFDVIWLGGGNAYYLRWVLKKSGFDQVIRSLLESGTVYGGGSAGAIVAGPTLKHFDLADEPEKAPELIEGGLSLTDKVIIPHWGHSRFGEPTRQIKELFSDGEFQTIEITDEQAVVINADEVKIIPTNNGKPAK